MKELSIFIDESGDGGAYEAHSPYYLVTLVFHDQAVDISSKLAEMQERLRLQGVPDYTVHAGPLIRREKEYKDLDIVERQKVFNKLYHFIRILDIRYHTIVVEKKHLDNETDLVMRIARQLSSFLQDNLMLFSEYDRIVVYYDNGQRELNIVLVSTFTVCLNAVEFKKASPADYKLFQAADMICTLELLELKRANKSLSNSEIKFFRSPKDLYKSYIKAIRKKRFGDR